MSVHNDMVFSAPKGRQKVAQGASPGSRCRTTRARIINNEPQKGATDGTSGAPVDLSPLRGSIEMTGWKAVMPARLPRAYALGYFLPPLRG